MLTVSEIRTLEEKAKKIGLEERALIENASSSLFEVIDELNLGKKVLAVAGRGNNGADVLSCARKLLSRGYDVRIVILKEKDLEGNVLFQKNILEKIGIQLFFIDRSNVEELEGFINESDFVLDGILGIGVKGKLPPFLQEVIRTINKYARVVVACDIPSGLSPDDGVILGEAVRADYTVTFITPKKGFFLGEGKKLVGKIFVVDIGISRDLLEKI